MFANKRCSNLNVCYNRPGINYFANLPDLLCVSRSVDVHDASAKMRRYNARTS